MPVATEPAKLANVGDNDSLLGLLLGGSGGGIAQAAPLGGNDSLLRGNDSLLGLPFGGLTFVGVIFLSKAAWRRAFFCLSSLAMSSVPR